MNSKILILIILIFTIPFFCFSKVNYIERTVYGEWIFRYEIYSKTTPPEYENGSNSQTIISSQGDTYLMENRANLDIMPASCMYPLKEEDYTGESRLYCQPYFYGYTEKDYASLKKIAEDAIRDATHLHEAISNIIRYVRENVTYSRNGQTDPLRVLAYGRTYCVGYANLAVILLRSAGIPARSMSCYMSPGKNWGNGYGGWHEYIEVFYPGTGWLSCDPQDSIFFVDPYHIIMSRNASYRRQVSDEKKFTTTGYTVPESFRKTRAYDLKKRLVEGEKDMYVFKGTVLLEEGEQLNSSSIYVKDYPLYFTAGSMFYMTYSYDIIIKDNTFMFGFSKKLFPHTISLSINNHYMNFIVDDFSENIIQTNIDLKSTKENGQPNPHILAFEFYHPLTTDPMKHTDIYYTCDEKEVLLGRTDKNGNLSVYCKDEKEKRLLLTSTMFSERKWYDPVINPSGKLYFTFHHKSENQHYISRTYKTDVEYFRYAYLRDGCTVYGTISCPGTDLSNVSYAFSPKGDDTVISTMNLVPLAEKKNNQQGFRFFCNKKKNEITIIQYEQGTFVYYDKKNLVILPEGGAKKHIRIDSTLCNLELAIKTTHKTPNIMIAENSRGKAVQGIILPVEPGHPINCYVPAGEYYLALNDVIMRKIMVGDNLVQVILDAWSPPNLDLIRDYYSISCIPVETAAFPM